MFTILVVESNHNLLELYKQALGEEGYDVIGCASASEAQIKLTHMDKIHLVLLEMHASIQSGARLLKDLASTNLKLKIIHNAGNTPIAANAMTAYAHERLTKSGDLMPLLALIRKLLQMGICNVQTAWHDAVGHPTLPILAPVGSRFTRGYDSPNRPGNHRRRRKK